MIGSVEKNVNVPPVDAEGQAKVDLRGETVNINCGFSSTAPSASKTATTSALIGSGRKSGGKEDA